MTSDSPYLSVVMVSRNDDHGGNPLQRTQLCINSFYEQCNRYGLPAELIVVDWNPPQGRPGLAEVIQWPKDRRFVRTRVITVPPEFHCSLAHSKNLPLFQMIGKNVGIRRARGEYVLATNIDILFSDELMEFLAERPLRPGHSYRVDRFDVQPDVLTQSPETVIPYAKDNVIRVNMKLGTFFQFWVGRAGKSVDFISGVGMGIFANDVTIHITRLFLNIPRYLLDIARFLVLLMRKTNLTGIIPGLHEIEEVFNSFMHLITRSFHSIASRFFSRSRTKSERKNSLVLLFGSFGYRLMMYVDSGFPFVHLNGCGDFTLLSKEDWDRLGGYIEDPIFSWHVDSLFLIDAYYLGIREVYLPYPKNIFHVEHGAGSGWTPGRGEELLFERLEKNHTPYFSWDDCLDYAKKWRKTQDKWGLIRQMKKTDYGFLKWDLSERVIE